MLVVAACGVGGGADRPDEDAATTTAAPSPTTTAAPTTTTAPPFEGWVDPASSGEPYGDAVNGLLTFRGNPTRTYYGQGPMPTAPQVLWTYPGSAMCSESSEGSETRVWCGSGWTGQPAVFERNGVTWVVFGAYDRAVHFLDATTGADLRPPFPTGDIIKGSVTVDPDGYPLVYTGSRDNYYRALAIDRNPVEELWSISADAVSPTMWNNDWDGSGLVIDDTLFEGGENSQFHVVKLNRAGGTGEGDPVTVAPQLIFNTPGWDDQLLADIGDTSVSIENSVAISGNTAYFANSGGLVQGWDIGPLRPGGAGPAAVTRTFRFWTGDDTDASVVIDRQGMLYVASEYERGNARSAEVGQIMKLDPTRPDDPLVWSIPDLGTNPAGVWATPAIHRGMLYVPTDGGRLLGVDRRTGQIVWEKSLPGPTWQSPVVVDDVLLQGDCNGFLHAYDVSSPRVDPPELWTVELGGCIESTPAVWKGRIYVGTRAGRFFAIGDA
ncbi:MAG: PQQ-binding-like beta-propeller repeat protein [Microthrixaceae bacterium]|nr:PQQ-binding-like beta-propeller repeat protein [Microthrixaceae bacterium]